MQRLIIEDPVDRGCGQGYADGAVMTVAAEHSKELTT